MYLIVFIFIAKCNKINYKTYFVICAEKLLIDIKNFLRLKMIKWTQQKLFSAFTAFCKKKNFF